MKTSETIQDLSKAMSLMQSQIKPAVKDSMNSHFKSRYSDISSVWNAIRDPMTSNGLTVWQDVTTEEKHVSVTTRVVHASGQWVEFGPLSVPMSKTDAHGVGSAISYAKRYALCAALGVVSGDEDDDGNASMPEKLVQKKEVTPINNQNITSDQIVELTDFLLNTPEDFQNKFWAGLKGMNPPIKRMADIPTDLFIIIRNKLLENQINPIFVTK